MKFPIKRFFNKRWKVVLAFFIFLFFCFFTSLFGFYYAVKLGAWGTLPSDNELLHLKNYKASEVYTSDSILIGKYFVENRTECEYNEVAPIVFKLLIATEDVRFYEHTGIDNKSLMRVLFKSIILGQHAGGGSTLSQQLIKNVYGRGNYGMLSMPVNKVKEAVLANQLEHLYSKQEVLMLYLNTVSFGEDTYGITAASQRFFSCFPSELKAEQAAVLVGMLKAPTSYNPRLHPSASLNRRNTVLYQGVKNKVIDRQFYNMVKGSSIILRYKRIQPENAIAPYFKEYIRKKVEDYLLDLEKVTNDNYNLYTDGLKIYTSIHSKLQKYAEESVVEHLEKLQKELDEEFKNQNWFSENQSLLNSELKKYNAILSDNDKKGSYKVYNQNHEVSWSRLDSVKYYLTRLKAGFLVTDPRNSQVLAWVGGPSYKYFKYDHVLSSRQVGSTFKPIVYAAALNNGTSMCDYILNQKVIYEQYDNWSPRNSGGHYEGKYSVIGALTNSVNTVSVRLCMESGIEKVVDLAHRLGIEDSLPQVPSIALGTGVISLKEMVTVYNTFANEGVKQEMKMILSLKSNSGKELYKIDKSSNQVLSQRLVNDLTQMLMSVVDNGTANRLRSVYDFKGGIAGKTGTTQGHTDGWFIGYTQGFVGGVWVGADNPSVHFSGISKGQGAYMALPIWALFYQKLLNDSSIPEVYKKTLQNQEDIDCELYRDNMFIEKLFRKKERKSNKTGLKGSREKKGLRGLFKPRKRKNN